MRAVEFVRRQVRTHARSLTVALLVAVPVATAAIAAGSHATPSTRFAATAVVLARPFPDAPDPLRLRQTAVRLVEEAVSLEDALFFPRSRNGETTASGNPSTGTVRVTARGDTPEVAKATADTIAQQAARFAKAPVELDDLAVDPAFESMFSVEPRTVVPVRRGARVGPTAARVNCPPRPGCGAMIQLFRPFAAGVTYRARAYARSSNDRTPVYLLLGAKPPNFSTGPKVRLSKRWRRYEVSWTSEENANFAEVGIQTQADKPAKFLVDGISVEDPTVDSGVGTSFTPPRRREPLAVSFTVVSPRGGVEEVGPRTAVWALGGFGLGLVLSGFGGLSGWAAARRRKNSRSDVGDSPN